LQKIKIKSLKRANKPKIAASEKEKMSEHNSLFLYRNIAL